MSIRRIVGQGRWALAALLGLAALAGGARAQYFGENKVQYRDHVWNSISADHFVVYFDKGADSLAMRTLDLAEKTQAVFSKRLNHTVVNQFGTLQVDIIRPDMFMVPTAKNGVPVALPTGDHFTCYKVKRSRGTPKFVKQTVTVTDQFQNATELVIKPVRLCCPANKNGEDPTAPQHPGHILCYKAKSQTKFGTLVVQIDNQFGPDQVTLIHRRELCVPTLKDPGATTTSTTIQATTTTSSPVATTTSLQATTTSLQATTTSSTTSTTLYGSPSRAFVTPVRSLFD